jgi:hypothetical protein
MININKEFVFNMILGSCLGDGGIEKACGKNLYSSISFTHNLKKELDYINFKKDLISKYYKTGILTKSDKKNTVKFRISSNEYEITNKIIELTRKENNKRSLLKNNLNYINEIVLLFWYLDDGSLSIIKQKRKNGNINIHRKLRIALSSFDDDEIINLTNYINEKYDLNFKTNKENNKIVSIGINNNLKEITKFLDIILPYKEIIPECMHYKFCLCYTDTFILKNNNYKNYNICDFYNTCICTCRNKDMSYLLNNKRSTTST